MSHIFVCSQTPCTANKFLRARIQPITLECLRRSFKNFPVFPSITVIAAWGKFLSHKLVRRLGDAVRRKNGFLLHDNAPTHLSVLVKEFLANNKVTTLEHPSYSPDLAAADVYLFPRLKPALKGGACVMLLTSLTMRRKSRKGFSKIASRNVSETFIVAGGIV